jgi:hypothetical protein
MGPQPLDLLAEMRDNAVGVCGLLVAEELGWKYAWIKSILRAKWAHLTLPEPKALLFRRWDKAMYLMAGRSRRQTLQYFMELGSDRAASNRWDENPEMGLRRCQTC